ncbi:hypothetical protein NFI96_029464 [Prochilodus magdalenae]|nr:hypothetical protein NFI96_029464 [Prochilodus magdalenae]
MSLKWLVTLSVFLIVGDRSNGQDVRVKLCGREFIRMVVTSCGSSRLRRSALDINHTHYSIPSMSLFTGQIMDDFSSGQLARVQIVEDEQWPDDVSLDKETENGSAGKTTEQSRTVPNAGQPVSVSSRAVRDVGPAGVCCRSGCTMSELVQYC